MKKFFFIAKNLILSLRLISVAVSVLILLASYSLIHMSPQIGILCGLIATTCFVMSFNDWYDRIHDHEKKNKSFAFKESTIFKIWISYLALIAFIANFYIFLNVSWLAGTLLLLLASLGLVYGGFRRIPYLSALTVSISQSLVVFLARPQTGYALSQIVLALTVFAIIFGRETLKDLQDSAHDVSWKKTLPALKGNVRGSQVVLCSHILLLVVLAVLTVFVGNIFILLSLVSTGIILLRIYNDPRSLPTNVNKRLLDLACILALAGVYFVR
ncbi:MAG: hypothetical protein JWM20_130 [Patescibacteria group bacterium]|nr:hypothetical protein [Patescibacteria group bacterium]